MCVLFTDDDVGKPVENDDGEKVGVVASVDGDVVHVRSNADAVNSGDSSDGAAGVVDRTRQLDADSVREITDDAVRLEGDLPMEDEAVEEKRYHGLEADPTALTGDGDPVTPNEFSVEPDEDMEPTDAAVEPDEDMEPTDEPRHTDGDDEQEVATVRDDTDDDESRDEST
ncbi:hypothetical protein [Natrinema sp. CBA1119]|uniref:hypothetical protein n=1 Tax=Natrinema sp. CBA1119 TaxID=1608465 RepID=UPI00159BDA04|nr:hypothetical protein [Natrinema sp. CBA1119]